MAPAVLLDCIMTRQQTLDKIHSNVFIVFAHDGRCRNPEHTALIHRMVLCTLDFILSKSKVALYIFRESRLLMKPLLFLYN